MKKRITSLIVVLCMALSMVAPAMAADYGDMPTEGYWSHEALTAAVENGLLQGSGGKLRPQAELTRAELAAVLIRAFGATESAETAFTDVEQSDWFAQAVARAVRMGAFQGDGAQMRPNDPITRQEVFTVLARAFQLNGGAQEALDFYADSGEVASWAADAMTAMVTVGYVKGDEGLLRPQDNITREEFAKVMDTLVSDYITETGTYTSVAGGSLVIRTPDVTLKNVTVSGDLIVGDGVGDGDVTLDNVTVEGRLVVRGGGENSIHIVNNSDVGSLVISKTASGGVRVVTADGAKVRTVYVADGNDDVVLEGAFESVTVETTTPVVLREAQVENLTVAAENGSVALEGTTTVTSVEIPKTAVSAAVTVAEEATVTTVVSAAENVTISGEGSVESVTVSGSNTAVDVNAGEIVIEPETEGTTQNGEEVEPAPELPPVTDDDDDDDWDDDWYDDDDNEPVEPNYYTTTVTTGEELAAALADPYCEAIILTGSGEEAVEINGGSYTITKPLTIKDLGKGVYFTDATVTNNSTITVDGSSINIGRVRGYEETGEPVTSAGNLVNNGTITATNSTISIFNQAENAGEIRVSGGHLNIWYGAEMENTGTIIIENETYMMVGVLSRMTYDDGAKYYIQTKGVLTNEGDITVRSGATLDITGNLGVLTNEENGDISLDEGILLLYYGALLTNNGDIVSGNNSRIEVTNTVPFDIPIEGEKEKARLVNNGTITFSGGSTLVVDEESGAELIDNGTINGDYEPIEPEPDPDLPAGTVQVTTAEELAAALADDSCEEIVISGGTGEITIEGGTYTITKPMTIGGEEQRIYFTNVTMTNAEGNTITFVGDEPWGADRSYFYGTEGGLVNNGTLNVSGFLAASQSGLENNGTINIKDGVLVAGLSEMVNNSEINVANGDSEGILCADEGSEIINNGSITCSGGHIQAVYGGSITNSGKITLADGGWSYIECDNSENGYGSSKLVNEIGGTIELTNEASMNVLVNSVLENKGEITIDGAGIDVGRDYEDEEMGRRMDAGTLTNSGTVTVTEGWLNVIGGTSDGASTLTNSGAINLTNSYMGVGQVYVASNGEQWSSHGTLTNSGTITANDSWLNLNYEGTELKNTASGKISVSSSDDKDAGLDVSSALLTNNGEITVTGSNTFFGVGYDYVEEDFRHTGFGTLINAGAIILDGVDLHIVGGSSVTNSGTITMNGENHINVGRVHEENEVQYTSDGTLTMTDGGTIAAGESFTGAVCVWTDTSVVTGIPEEIPVVLQYEENNSDGGETENNAA